MQKEEFINIADKVSEGLATDQEKQLFLFHLRTFVMQNPEWEKFAYEFRQQIEDEIKSDIRVQIFGETKQKSKTIKLWPRMIGIASAIALVVLGVYFFNYRNDKHAEGNVLAAQDIEPGTVNATLTLANGKKIKLSDAANGEIAKEAGISVTKTADGQLVYEIKETTGNPNEINTLSTAKGETYILTLPDKSKVWLNAASSLTYSATLKERGVRRVKLEGEAYFEISKDKLHPFVVESNGQEVEVLGTHFNIRAYSDEPAMKTTLLEGSVKVSVFGANNRPASEKITFLKPNQQAAVVNHSIKVRETDATTAIAWKDGYFRFQDNRIEAIMLELSRWYNIEVVYQGEMTKDGFNGKISRFRNINEVLKILENTELVHFKIEGRRIIVLR